MQRRTARIASLSRPPTLRDHWGQLTDQPVVSGKVIEWTGLRLSSLRETDGDVVMPALERDTVVLTVEGFRRHVVEFAQQKHDSPIRPGDVASIPRGAGLASCWQNHEKLQTFHVVELTPEVFTTYTPEIATVAVLRGHLIPQGFSEKPGLAHMIQLLSREHDVERRRGKLFADTLIRLLAIEIAGRMWTEAPDNVNANPFADQRVKRAIDFIEAHFNNDVSILDISVAAGLSPSQLTAAFQRTLGQSPYSFVISRRLQRATELLRESELTIAHVALEVGFSDQAHLTRLCRARLGKTPRQIRLG